MIPKTTFIDIEAGKSVSMKMRIWELRNIIKETLAETLTVEPVTDDEFIEIILSEIIQQIRESAYFFGMHVEEFHSLRLFEVVEFIEAASNRYQQEIEFQKVIAGQICATIANFSGSKKRYKPKDFFQIGKRNNKLTPVEEQAEILKQLTISMGGSVEGW